MDTSPTLPLVVALEGDSIRAQLPRPAVPHLWQAYAATQPEDIVPRLQGAQAVIINKCRLNAEVLAALPALRMVSVSATGVDNVDLAACRARGIVVTNVRDYACESVAEHALMLMLALRRRLLDYVADVRAGRWAESPIFCLFDHPVRELSAATLGIVGRGALGEALAARAKALGMRVLYADRKGEASVREGYTPFEAVLREADVISLHCPLGPATKRLIGPVELAAMKHGALLINTARGGLVDEQALADALRKGHLGGAATDVLSTEPPRSPNPLLAAGLPNLIVTPHMAWASEEAMQRLADRAVANVEAFLGGGQINNLA